MGLVPRSVARQWSTLESGPLASWEKAETRQKPRNDVSQWSTLESGPLATREKAEFRHLPPIKRELVVHSGEWTTGYLGKGGIPGKISKMKRASGPL